MTVDYIWFLCLPATSVFLPKGEDLVYQVCAVDFDDIAASETAPLVGAKNKQKPGCCV